ncbi:MAG: DNA polymerase III subunit delta [Planctomycetota bacterium]
MPSSQPKPIYVLIGDDPYLQDQHRSRIISELIGQADPQTCVSTHSGDAALADVLDDLRTLAFLASHRVVIVKDADAFVSKHRDKLENYLEKPASSGSLILEVSSLPKNQRIYKAANRVGLICPCAKPDKKSLPGWIRNEAGRLGVKIDSRAVQMLADAAGTNLAQLAGEMEKLATYVGDRAQITAEDVGQIVPAATGAADFELTNALTEGNLRRAMNALPPMLQTKGDEFKALGLIRWHLHKALAAAEALAAGQRPDQAAAVANVPGFLRRDFMNMVQKRGLGKIQSDMRRLLQADLAMKSGATAESAMRDLVVGLCL